MKFMVVIILDDRKTELARQFEEAQAPFGAQRHRCRKLMMRGDEHRPHHLAATGLFDSVDIDAVLVEIDGSDHGAQRAEGGDRGIICQRLDQYRIDGSKQHLRCQEKAVLGAAGARSEEGRLGKECVSTWRSRGGPSNSKT